MCQPLYGTHASWSHSTYSSARKEHERAIARGFIQHPTPPDNQITHRICPHLHVHRSIVLNGPELFNLFSRNAQSKGNRADDKSMRHAALIKRARPQPQRTTLASAPLSQGTKPRFSPSQPITANNARPGISQDGRQSITHAIRCGQHLEALPHSRGFTPA